MRGAALLLLADGRLPTGGHVHSGGIEAAAADGRVFDVPSLGAYLLGRLSTAGRADAFLAAAARAGAASWSVLEAEASARCPSPAQRAASRAQGRGMLRAARALWPGVGLDRLSEQSAGRPMWPVALGATSAAAGLSILDAATAAGYGCVSGPAWAAVRLLGLDPLAVMAEVARLGPVVDAMAAVAAEAAVAVPSTDLRLLPGGGGPVVDVAAEAHARWEVRLFAS